MFYLFFIFVNAQNIIGNFRKRNEFVCLNNTTNNSYRQSEKLIMTFKYYILFHFAANSFHRLVLQFKSFLLKFLDVSSFLQLINALFKFRDQIAHVFEACGNLLRSG